MEGGPRSRGLHRIFRGREHGPHCGGGLRSRRSERGRSRGSNELAARLRRACPVWVHFHARLVFIVTDRIVLLRVRPTAPSRRPFDPPSPGYFLFSGIRISFSSLPSLVFSSRARRSARFCQRPELRLG